jgi:trk system potassium uptake protein
MNMIGIQQVVSPRLSAINSILQHIRRGKVLSAKAIKGEQAEVMEALALETSDIVGKPLKNISFPKGALVTGIIRENNITIPSGESIIMPGDRIIIFAQRFAIPKVERVLMVKLEYFNALALYFKSCRNPDAFFRSDHAFSADGCVILP